MTKVLIADALKPSIVMSSEVFKDKIPGALVVLASTGEQALQLAQTENPDICLVDFDLPDVDGPSLIVALRKFYSGPILMTAYPDEHVEKAVFEDLYAYNDASSWIKKPVRFEELSTQIEKFLLEKRRTGRRFDMEIPTLLIGKGEGRGKRAPKFNGKLLNISLGGACIQLTDKAKVKKKQELVLAVRFMNEKERKKMSTAVAAKKAPKTVGATVSGTETKIKATIAWISQSGQVGLQFSRLTDDQQGALSDFLRGEARLVAA